MSKKYVNEFKAGDPVDDIFVCVWVALALPTYSDSVTPAPNTRELLSSHSPAIDLKLWSGILITAGHDPALNTACRVVIACQTMGQKAIIAEGP